jgi:hypothetical protein
MPVYIREMQQGTPNGNVYIVSAARTPIGERVA